MLVFDGKHSHMSALIRNSAFFRSRDFWTAQNFDCGCYSQFIRNSYANHAHYIRDRYAIHSQLSALVRIFSAIHGQMCILRNHQSVVVFVSVLRTQYRCSARAIQPQLPVIVRNSFAVYPVYIRDVPNTSAIFPVYIPNIFGIYS